MYQGFIFKFCRQRSGLSLPQGFRFQFLSKRSKSAQLKSMAANKIPIEINGDDDDVSRIQLLLSLSLSLLPFFGHLSLYRNLIGKQLLEKSIRRVKAQSPLLQTQLILIYVLRLTKSLLLVSNLHLINFLEIWVPSLKGLKNSMRVVALMRVYATFKLMLRQLKLGFTQVS